MSEEDTTDVTTETADETTDGDPFAAERAAAAAESKKYRQRAQKAEADVKALEGKVLSDEAQAEYDTLKAEKAEADETAQKAEGKFDELLAQKMEAAASEKAEVVAERDTAMAAFERVAVLNPLQESLAKLGVSDVGAAAHLIQNRHTHHATAKLIDGKAVVQVVDDQGNLVTDAGCDPGQSVSIDKLAAEWTATDTGKHFLPASGDTGSGSHQGGTDDTVTLAMLDADIDLKQKFIEEKGEKAYTALVYAERKKNQK